MKVMISFFLMCLAFTGCGQSKINLEKEWLIKVGRVGHNYELQPPYSKNKIRFHNGIVDLKSGFFYQVDTLDNDVPEYRFPYVYYGNKERYKIKGDSVLIYSQPYNRWYSYKMRNINSREIHLIGYSDTLQLIENKTPKANVSEINFIMAELSGFDLFKINYCVKYSPDDSLVFEGIIDSTGLSKHFEFKLPKGTFADICQGFNDLDLANIEPIYPSSSSEIATIKLEIRLKDGSVIESELQNSDYPDELRLALIPVIYSYQRFLYRDLRPVFPYYWDPIR